MLLGMSCLGYMPAPPELGKTKFIHICIYILNLIHEKDTISNKYDLICTFFFKDPLTPPPPPQSGQQRDEMTHSFVCHPSTVVDSLPAKIPLLPLVPRGRAASLSDSRRQIHSIVFPSIGPDPGGLRQKIQRHNIISEGRTQHRMAGQMDFCINPGIKTCLTDKPITV